MTQSSLLFSLKIDTGQELVLLNLKAIILRIRKNPTPHIPMNDPPRTPIRIYGTLKGHRRFFSAEDDNILRSLKESQPTITWAELSERMSGFTSRQLRERWCHYLSPALKTAEWTPEEDEELLRLHTELGSRWGTIGTRMNNRSAPDVKNRYQMLRNRRRVRRNRRRSAKPKGDDSLPDPAPPPPPADQKEKHPPDKNTEFSISNILV
jgi:hypothetical protein